MNPMSENNKDGDQMNQGSPKSINTNHPRQRAPDMHGSHDNEVMVISETIKMSKGGVGKSKNNKMSEFKFTKPANFSKLGEKEKERLFLSCYDENIKLKDYQRTLENQILDVKTKMRAIEERNGELKRRQNMTKEEENLFEENLKLTREVSMLKANLINLQDTVKKMFEENLALKAKSDKQRKLYSTLSGGRGQKNSKASISGLQRPDSSDHEAQRLIQLLQKQLKDMKNENDRLQELIRNPGSSPASEGLGHKDPSSVSLVDRNLKLVELEHKLRLLQSTQEASQYRLEEAAKSLQTTTNELIREREARARAEENVKSMELSVMMTKELQEENKTLKAQILKLEAELKQWTLSPFLSDQTEKAAASRKLVDMEAKIIDLEARMRTALELERRSQEDLKLTREQLQKITGERDFHREEAIRLKETINKGVLEIAESKKYTEQEIRAMLGLDGTNPNKPVWAQMDLMERERDVDLTDLASCNREIIRLKAEKAELAAHLESAQNNLRIQRDLFEAKERLFEKEKKKFEMGGKAAQGRIEELSRILANRAGPSISKKGDSGDFDYDDSVSVFTTATIDYRDMVEQENLFDVYIGRVDFYPGALSQFLNARGLAITPPLSTFSVMDFFNHEPLKTPSFEGFSPLYNFQFTYRMKVDNDFLGYCKDDSFKIEFFAKVGPQSVLVGKSTVKLLPILQRTLKLFEDGHENTCAVISGTTEVLTDKSGSSIGSMSYRYRIRQPFARILEMMVKTHGSLPKDSIDLGTESEFATIVVSIARGSGFPPSSMTFVHYNFLGAEKCMTETMSGSSPVYNYHQNHDFEYCEQTKDILQREQLKFVVFDESVELEGNQDNDIIGTATYTTLFSLFFCVCSVGLNGLLAGPRSPSQIDEVLSVVNKRGQRVGSLKVRIQLVRAGDKPPSPESLGLTQEKRPSQISEFWISECIAKIAKALRDKGLSLDSSFKIFDINNSGYVSFEEFSSVISSVLSITFAPNEIQLIWRRITGSDFSGHMNSHKFAEVFGGYLSNSQLQSINALTQRRQVPIENEAEQMKGSVFQIGAALRNYMTTFKKTPEELFNRLDLNKDGSISLMELKQGLEHVIMREIHPSEAIYIFKMLDTDLSKSIDIRELFRLFELGLSIHKPIENKGAQVQIPPIRQGSPQSGAFLNSGESNVKPPEHQDLDPAKIFADFTEILSKYMDEHKLSVTSLVLRMDQDRSNYVSKAEFRAFFSKKIQVKISERDLDIVFDFADKEPKDGRLSVNEFIRMLRLGSKIRFASKQVGLQDSLESNGVLAFLVDYLTKQKISLVDFFAGIDENNDGFVDLMELTLFFRKIDAPIDSHEIEHFISLLDSNNDHRLSRKELQVYFEKYKELSLQKANPQVQNEISSQSMVASSMQRMSQLSLSSKVARMNGIFNKLATALKKEKFSKKSLFNAIDRNHSGRIDRDELATAFNSMKIILADDELDFIFSSLDKDQSGFVDENEFLSQLP